MSNETKAKQSKTHKGKNNARARAVYQIDKTTGKIIKKWNYIGEAVNTLRISSIFHCCKGKIKTAGGYVWKYADELDKIPEFSN